jgi:hypothetical protein
VGKQSASGCDQPMSGTSYERGGSMAKLSRIFIIKSLILAAFVGLCISVQAESSSPANPSTDTVVEVSPPPLTLQNLSVLGTNCLLGSPPVGKCDMLKQAYCQALSACLNSALSSNPSGQAKGKQQAKAADGQLSSGLRSIPADIVTSGSIFYHCLSALGCGDEENPNTSK